MLRKWAHVSCVAFLLCGCGGGGGTPTLSINNVTQLEGDSGPATFTFTVTLSEAAAQDVNVAYATIDGSAVAGTDYTADSGVLIISAGDTSVTLDVDVTGETTFEYNEDFFVMLSNSSNALILDDVGRAVVQNDDPRPDLSIDDVVLAEGDSGTTSFDFTVSLSEAAGVWVIVDYDTGDGTATIADSDYDAALGTLSLAPGALSIPLTITVNGDVTAESDEDFYVNLSNATNADITDDQGLGTIQNDD